MPCSKTGCWQPAETLAVKGWFEACRADRVSRRARRSYCHFQPLGDNVRETVACKTMWFGYQIPVCCSRSLASHLDPFMGASSTEDAVDKRGCGAVGYVGVDST